MAMRRLGLGAAVEPNSMTDDSRSNEVRVREREREIFLKLIRVEGLEVCFCF